jgi:NAD(P)-dependent dehydrogenase (short-subunit alcohol dehydrogenase family)
MQEVINLFEDKTVGKIKPILNSNGLRPQIFRKPSNTVAFEDDLRANQKGRRLMKKTILITGTSTGFGRTAAETLAQRGYSVFATMRDCSGRNRLACEALRALADREGWELDVLEMDVTNDASVNQAVEQALERAGRIDVVINNAGISALGITEAFTVEQFQQVLEVNLFGAVRVNRAVLPAMRRQRGGLLIHVSSAAGRAVLPGFAAYCASKYALEALADVYRFELSGFGIDSVLVEPGVHRTPILEKFLVPADQGRVAEYGSTAEAVDRVKGIFEGANRAAETPGPEGVVETFVRLIETPAGERPFRTVPTATLQPLLEPYNALAATMRDTLAQIFQVSELTLLRQTASEALATEP